VDSLHYAKVLDRMEMVPPAAKQWERPVFGYTGTIHPERLHVDLVYQVANGLERGSIVLLGPNHLGARDCSRLRSTGRVHVLGPVPYAEIPDWMRAFDVCIVPHRVTAFTESLNPIKLWEYLAAGKPIVSTAVAGFRDYPEFVYLASDAEQFSTALGAALSESHALPVARRAEALKHSWTNRISQIEEIFASFVGDGRTGDQGAVFNSK